MVLSSDPSLMSRMPLEVQGAIKKWLDDSCYLNHDEVTWISYISEANYLIADVLHRHPESGKFYAAVDEGKVEPKSSRFLIVPEKPLDKRWVYEWRRAMIAYQGHQGA